MLSEDLRSLSTAYQKALPLSTILIFGMYVSLSFIGRRNSKKNSRLIFAVYKDRTMLEASLLFQSEMQDEESIQTRIVVPNQDCEAKPIHLTHHIRSHLIKWVGNNSRFELSFIGKRTSGWYQHEYDEERDDPENKRNKSWKPFLLSMCGLSFPGFGVTNVI